MMSGRAILRASCDEGFNRDAPAWVTEAVEVVTEIVADELKKERGVDEIETETGVKV